MRVTVEEQLMGYRVELGQGEQFDSVLARLKEEIPRSLRHFSDGHWLVEKRAQKRLEAWRAWLEEVGVEVITLRG